jgi:predicted RNase H-like nuclease (RuvC/YqgF family)
MAETINTSPESELKHNFSHSKENHEQYRLSLEDIKKQQQIVSNEIKKSREQVLEDSEETSQIKSKINKLEKNQSDVNNASVKLASKDLQKTTLRNELNHIRKELNPVDRIGSRIIHNKVVKVISTASSTTVARPSGLLGGGILALIGNLSYYAFAKSIGLKYNYLIFILLFVTGYFLATIIELLLRILRRKNYNNTRM